MTARRRDRPAEVGCEWCGVRFAPMNYTQRFCSAGCSTTWHHRQVGRHTLGPCPTCGQMFQSKNRSKRFCSLPCYTGSRQFAEMTRASLERLEPNLGVPRRCVCCGAEFPRAKKARFCSRACRRRHFAERFDRWVANPEAVALPQNFDEFLSRNVLPCPVAGCQWEGEFLGAHVNMAHGVTAREFKKLCGFNLSTGLVGEDLSRMMSDRNGRMLEAGVLPSKGWVVPPPQPQEHYRSLESREHQRKARAEQPSLRDAVAPCRYCGADVRQPYAGRRWYCSAEHRSRFYRDKGREAVRCAQCGEMFTGSRAQAVRVERMLPVCCSNRCRNHMNAAAKMAQVKLR